MKWKVYHHSYEQKLWLHVNHESGQWLEELLNNLHAVNFHVLRHTDQFIEVLVGYPEEYDGNFDSQGKPI